MSQIYRGFPERVFLLGCVWSWHIADLSPKYRLASLGGTPGRYPSVHVGLDLAGAQSWAPWGDLWGSTWPSLGICGGRTLVLGTPERAEEGKPLDSQGGESREGRSQSWRSPGRLEGDEPVEERPLGSLGSGEKGPHGPPPKAPGPSVSRTSERGMPGAMGPPSSQGRETSGTPNCRDQRWATPGRVFLD